MFLEWLVFASEGAPHLGDQLLVPDISSSPRWRQARSKSPEPGGSGAWPCPLGALGALHIIPFYASISLLIKWRGKCYESFLRCLAKDHRLGDSSNSPGAWKSEITGSAGSFLQDL